MSNDWDGSLRKRIDAFTALLSECRLLIDAKLDSITYIERLDAFEAFIRREIGANEDDIEIQKVMLDDACMRLGGLLVNLMFIKRLKVPPQNELYFWNPKREKIEDRDGFDWCSNNLA